MFNMHLFVSVAFNLFALNEILLSYMMDIKKKEKERITFLLFEVILNKYQAITLRMKRSDRV